MNDTPASPKGLRPTPGAPVPQKSPDHVPRPAPTRTVVRIAVVLAAIFLCFLIAGIIARFNTSRDLAKIAATTADTPPRVDVIKPLTAKAGNWTLPATTQAYEDAVIYARIAGYLSKRYVDIGDKVKTGELLAEIQSPETDQQLAATQANLQHAIKQLAERNTDLTLAKITMDRYVQLNKTGAVSQEIVDKEVASYNTSSSAVSAAQAFVDSNKADVQRYQALTAYERVLAPFDGVITQRNVDVGALITAGSPINNNGAAPTNLSGTATGMFEISQLDTIRIFVSVPQVIAANLKPGVKASVTVRGKRATPFEATVTRTADALDPGTRTLLTELDIANPSHALLPGEFVDVDFKLAPAGGRWNLPATALIFNGTGTQVMVVDHQNKLHLQDVVVGRDYGDTIDIQAGLNGDESVVAQPVVSLSDGEQVTPIESPPAQ